MTGAFALSEFVDDYAALDDKLVDGLALGVEAQIAFALFVGGDSVIGDKFLHRVIVARGASSAKRGRDRLRLERVF